jgi:hypothetical protein
MRASYVRVTALLTITALCACSGGGSSPSNPIPARAPVATSSAPANTASQTRATFVIHWPSGAQAAAATKRRKTISPSTQSISVTVNGGSPTVVNKPTLTGSPSTTSVTIYAPPGDDGFTFTAWDQLDASGAILDQATVNQTIIADANNTVSVALDGVCAALVPTLTQTGVYVQYQNETVPLASGSRTVLKSARLIGNFSKVFQFTRVDADGNTILTSAGSAPILVTESGSTTTRYDRSRCDRRFEHDVHDHADRCRARRLFHEHYGRVADVRDWNVDASEFLCVIDGGRSDRRGCQ